MLQILHEPIPQGQRFRADAFRITVYALFTCGLYGSGIGMTVYAAFLTVHAVQAGNQVSPLPWVLAFILMVSGMLAVIYGFFFRPREVRLSPDQVALVYWDGRGKVMDRNQVESLRISRSGIVLNGDGNRLVVKRIFSGWKRFSGEVSLWGGKTAP